MNRWKRCPPGVTTEVEAFGSGPSCTVLVGQASGDVGGWVLELSAKSAFGVHLVRREVLAARSSTVHGARVVMVESCPGVESWHVKVLGAGAAGRGLDVAVLADKCCAPSSLAWPSAGLPVSSWPAWAGRAYNTLGGVAGVVGVPAGFVTGITAYATAPGATVQVGGGPALPVPQNGALELAPPLFNLPTGPVGSLAAPVDIAFTGTAAYVVEYVA